MKINPQPIKFIIFSGGGGLVFRRQSVKLTPGINTFEIDEVPAAFDPKTATVELIDAPESIEVVQLDVKRPDKTIISQFMGREKTAATNIINAAADLRGQSREKIIQIVESTHYRSYEDVVGSFTVIINSKITTTIDLEIRYFLEDARIKWEPSVHIALDQTSGEATLEGFILVMNNSDFTYPQCELQFAEFELAQAVSEAGYLENLEAEQSAQNVVPQSQMVKNLKRMSRILM